MEGWMREGDSKKQLKVARHGSSGQTSTEASCLFLSPPECSGPVVLRYMYCGVRSTQSQTLNHEVSVHPIISLSEQTHEKASEHDYMITLDTLDQIQCCCSG